jgi:hypothetical protein
VEPPVDATATSAHAEKSKSYLIRVARLPCTFKILDLPRLKGWHQGEVAAEKRRVALNLEFAGHCTLPKEKR